MTEYLSNTGVLLTICLGSDTKDEDDTDPCDLFLTNQTSASWIQQGTIGPRTFSTYSGELGIILDPRQLNVECIYPLDAETLGRGKDPDYGQMDKCGGLSDQGLSWWQRGMNQAELKVALFRTKYSLVRDSLLGDAVLSFASR